MPHAPVSLEDRLEAITNHCAGRLTAFTLTFDPTSEQWNAFLDDDEEGHTGDLISVVEAVEAELEL